MMKLSYLRQREASLVDYIIDLRPTDIRAQQLPQYEINISIDRLETLFDAIKSK